MTYFGEALWQYAMPRADTLAQAFMLALHRVGEMEHQAQLVPSEPQMLVGRGAQYWLDQLQFKPAGYRVTGDPEQERPGSMPARAPESSSLGQSLTD
jgi:hypothetical protein